MKTFVEAGHLEPPLPRRLTSSKKDKAASKTAAAKELTEKEAAGAAMASHPRPGAADGTNAKPSAVFTLRGTAHVDKTEQGGIVLSRTEVTDVKLDEIGMADRFVAISDEKTAGVGDASAAPPHVASRTTKDEVPSSSYARAASKEGLPPSLDDVFNGTSDAAASHPRGRQSSNLKARSPNHATVPKGLKQDEAYAAPNDPGDEGYYYYTKEHGQDVGSYVPKDVKEEDDWDTVSKPDTVRLMFTSY